MLKSGFIGCCIAGHDAQAYKKGKPAPGLSHRTLASCLTIVLTLFAARVAVSQELPVVNSIEIRGLKRVEDGAVKSKISQKAGEPLSNEKTAEDIRNIYKMGYFDDVSIEIEISEGRIKLIYIVKEKPTIVRVEFQGNKELKDDKLKEKIAVTAGSIADTTLIQDNAVKIRNFYESEGYWLATVVPVIKKTAENEVSLTFQIEEGEKVRIKKIIIDGSSALSARQVKKAMKTEEWWIFSFISSSGYYKKDTMNADMEAIKDLYYNNGYIKAVAADPENQLTDDKKGMIITIRISEGEQYTVSSVSLAGNKAFPEPEIRKKIAVMPGTIFSKEALRKDVSAMTDLYTQNGYALANIYPDVAPDDAQRQVSLTYRIEEGDIYRIGRVEISGNIKTRDKVIRREIRLDEGDKFNSALLKRSYERVNNLNYFESVDLVPRPRVEEKMLDIDIKVKERPTGSLSIGGGYSSIDKLIGILDVTQGNLFGRGQYLKVKTEIGGVSTYYEISFRDPWFMDKPVSFTADIYKTTRQYIDYDRKATGFGFSFGKEFDEYWSGSASYKFEIADIYNVKDTAAYFVKEQVGRSTTSSITPSISRDTSDNYLDPSRGSRNSLYITLAGPGGTNYFIKGVADSAWFFPIGSTTVSLRGRFGYATGLLGRALPLYERFYVGGIYTVRGLGFGEAGPRDTNGELTGGTKELIFNAEYIFPIFKDVKLKGVAFVDAGNSYAQSEPLGPLRYTAGIGFRWLSPVGPIRIEWGYNIQRKPSEGKSKVEFTMGSFF